MNRLTLLWLACFVPATALVSAIFGAVFEMIAKPAGFFGFSLGASAWLVLGAVYRGGWALLWLLPYAWGLSVWCKLAAHFGDTDTTRFRIAVGMFVWSLPQAVCIGVATEFAVFLIAWVVVALGLTLPRIAVPALRPGVFSSPGR